MCHVLQCVAVCCGVLQCVAVWNVLVPSRSLPTDIAVVPLVCRWVLVCVICCSVLQ